MEIPIKSNILRTLFRDCYFINGTACAGKSTMVRLLAEKHGGICCGENYHDVLMDAVEPAGAFLFSDHGKLAGIYQPDAPGVCPVDR